MSTSEKILKQLWSLLSDGKWDADPYKIVGCVCYGFAIYFAFRTYGIVDTLIQNRAPMNAGVIASLAGLPALIGGFGTVLFNSAGRIDHVYAAQYQAPIPSGTEIPPPNAP